jgi:hypothetical protein
VVGKFLCTDHATRAHSKREGKAAMPIPPPCTSLSRLIYADMDELPSAGKLAISPALLSRPPTRTEAMSNPWSTPKVLRWTNRTAPMLPSPPHPRMRLCSWLDQY